MKNNRMAKRKMILSICLAAGVLLTAVGVTLAIYTSQVYRRSVVRNRDNEIIRFSSDKLYRVTAGTDAQIYYYPMSEGQTTMTFQVCNYDQTKNTLFNEKRLEYIINVEVKDGTPDINYTISNGSETKTLKTGESTSFEETLTPGKRSAKTYTFTFDEAGYGKVKLCVTVTPKNLTVTQNRILNGILIPIQYATTQGITVRSEFTDSTRDTPDKFDAYNLSVSVSGGQGEVLITWDNTMLDIDPFFADGKTITKNGDESTITVPMNAEDETGTYLIQFYNHNNTKPGWTAWSELPITVKLKETTEP